MGGLGSGRRKTSKCNTGIWEVPQVDVRRWSQAGVLRPGTHFSWQWKPTEHVRLASAWVGPRGIQITVPCTSRIGARESWATRYWVPLTWTRCHFGGERPWFICPQNGCGRRVAILYVESVLACRHCCSLIYPSRCEPPRDRAARRALRIRQRLRWTADHSTGPCGKPKGMHWRTYLRLHSAYTRWLCISITGQIDYCQRAQQHLDQLADTWSRPCGPSPSGLQ